ncbi:hypothetical protein D3P09_16785 [Paenibacillus pinisoli]|uniref:Uncharacterized protein n=1 Tax=Paenibacillus pinisoli TaxID=1276110 RepID=A0A3A6PJ10_9BACL|nr:hypothetical protein [Paenibacillus pinisoli]RJX39148.1 hypothetical protein D3P09_16785 [Paenibacillus pinisoli]
MEGELGSGARIAIALIVIGVIISIIFVILGFTRGTTNQGITTVQNSMDSMSLAQFDDYDQKIMSGTQVVAAIKLFEGRPVAQLVRTTSFLGANPSLDTRGGHNYGALLTGATLDTSTKLYTKTTIAKKGSHYEVGLESTDGIKYNMYYLPTTQSGTASFVRPTAKFLAELIKDSTGTIVGICFTQQAS